VRENFMRGSGRGTQGNLRSYRDYFHLGTAGVTVKPECAWCSFKYVKKPGDNKGLCYYSRRRVHSPCFAELVKKAIVQRIITSRIISRGGVPATVDTATIFREYA
jgi:hypothetical protein